MLRLSASIPGRDRRRGLQFPALVALLALAALPAAAAAQIAPDRPAIDVQPTVLEFGVMQQNQALDQVVTIRNLGGAPLHIDEIRPDCGCTIAKLLVQDLPPGGETRVNINFNSQKFEGPIEKIVRIYSDDPTVPVFELPIRADIHVPLIIQPRTRQLGLGKVRVGHDAMVRAWFEAVDVPELQIELQRYDSGLFDVDILPRYEDDPQRAVMVVRARHDVTLGEHREFIRVGTNVPEMPTVDFEVFVEFVNELYVQPPRVNFRYAMKDRQLESTVRVRGSTPGTRFKVTGAEIDLPGFSAEVVEAVPNVETRVVVSGMPLETSDPRVQEAQGRMQGTLRIFTDLPGQPELQVKVLYQLRI